jgi:TetR/AcrR family transcriptional repressor of nem operon
MHQEANKAMTTSTLKDSRAQFLGAAIDVIRAKGYEATTVDDLCAKAGLTKGSFFHHFKSKEDLAVAAAQAWSEYARTLFADADYHRLDDPLERLLAYVDMRTDLIRGEVCEFTCLAGTMAQEIYQTRPRIRDACAEAIGSHAQTLEADIGAAIGKYGLHPEWTAGSLALHVQAVIQGAFVVAKAQNRADVAVDCLTHLKRYLSLLFSQPVSKEQSHEQ